MSAGKLLNTFEDIKVYLDSLVKGEYLLKSETNYNAPQSRNELLTPAERSKLVNLPVITQAQVDQFVEAYDRGDWNAAIVSDLDIDDETKIASAKAVFTLHGMIESINTLIASDDSSLDELQEIVDFIKNNKTDLESLGIANIAGLQAALDSKLETATAELQYARLDGTNMPFTGGLTVDSGAIPASILFEDDHIPNRYQFTTGGHNLESFFNVTADTTRASHIRAMAGTITTDLTSGFGRSGIAFSGADFTLRSGGNNLLTLSQNAPADSLVINASGGINTPINDQVPEYQFGNLIIGTGTDNGWGFIRHRSQPDNFANYGITLSSLGDTKINAVNGRNLYLDIGNASKMVLTSTQFTSKVPITITNDTAYDALLLTGNFDYSFHRPDIKFAKRGPAGGAIQSGSNWLGQIEWFAWDGTIENPAWEIRPQSDAFGTQNADSVFQIRQAGTTEAFKLTEGKGYVYGEEIYTSANFSDFVPASTGGTFSGNVTVENPALVSFKVNPDNVQHQHEMMSWSGKNLTVYSQVSQSWVGYMITSVANDDQNLIGTTGIKKGVSFGAFTDGQNVNIGNFKTEHGGGVRYYASVNGTNKDHTWYGNGVELMRLNTAGGLQVGNTIAHRWFISNDGEMSHFYAAEAHPRTYFDRDFRAAGQNGMFFGTGTASVEESGVGVARSGNRTFSVYTSDGTALEERLSVDGSGNISIKSGGTLDLEDSNGLALGAVAGRRRIEAVSGGLIAVKSDSNTLARVQGADAVNDDEFVTKAQLTTASATTTLQEAVEAGPIVTAIDTDSTFRLLRNFDGASLGLLMTNGSGANTFIHNTNDGETQTWGAWTQWGTSGRWSMVVDGSGSFRFDQDGTQRGIWSSSELQISSSLWAPTLRVTGTGNSTAAFFLGESVNNPRIRYKSYGFEFLDAANAWESIYVASVNAYQDISTYGSTDTAGAHIRDFNFQNQADTAGDKRQVILRATADYGDTGTRGGRFQLFTRNRDAGSFTTAFSLTSLEANIYVPLRIDGDLRVHSNDFMTSSVQDFYFSNLEDDSSFVFRLKDAGGINRNVMFLDYAGSQITSSLTLSQELIMTDSQAVSLGNVAGRYRLQADGSRIVALNAGNSLSRVRGGDAVENDEFVTMSQLNAVTGSQNLQQVTDQGAVTSNGITVQTLNLNNGTVTAQLSAHQLNLNANAVQSNSQVIFNDSNGTTYWLGSGIKTNGSFSISSGANATELLRINGSETQFFNELLINVATGSSNTSRFAGRVRIGSLTNSDYALTVDSLGAGALLANGNAVVTGHISLGSGSGDSHLRFWDNNDSGFKEIKWDASLNAFRIQDEANAFHTIVHSGNIGSYVVSEADTLDTVTGRGATTTNDVTVGKLKANGQITSSSAVFQADGFSRMRDIYIHEATGTVSHKLGTTGGYLNWNDKPIIHSTGRLVINSSGSSNLMESNVASGVLELRPSDTRTGIQAVLLYRSSNTGTVSYMLANAGDTLFGRYSSANAGPPTDYSDLIRLSPANGSLSPELHIGDAGSTAARLYVGGTLISDNGSLNANTVNGFGVSVEPAADTLVLRDSNSYLNTSWINLENDTGLFTENSAYFYHSGDAWIIRNQSAHENYTYLKFQLKNVADVGGVYANSGNEIGFVKTNASGWQLRVDANDNLIVYGGNLYIDGNSASKRALAASGNWLYLNPDTSFTSGTYVPGLFRADGGLQVGSGGSSLNVTASGYTTINGQLAVAGHKVYLDDATELGHNAGDTFTQLEMRKETANTDRLIFSNTRVVNGMDWTTAGYRIQQKVDSTYMGYIQFNGDNNNGGISFGAGLTTASAIAIPEVFKISGGAAKVSGTLQVTSTAYLDGPIRMGMDVWHTSEDNNERLYFAVGSHTYIKAVDRVVFRTNNTNINGAFVDGNNFFSEFNNGTSWGVFQNGNFHSHLNDNSSATWLLTADQKDAGDVKYGIQALNTGESLRFYSGSNFLEFTGNVLYAGNVSSDNLYVDRFIYHDGDTDTYMDFHAANSWRVVTGNTQRLEVNNSYIRANNSIWAEGSVYGGNGGANGSGAGIMHFAPGGASYSTQTPTVNGAIKITLPGGFTNRMLRMTIKVYEYTNNESFTVECGGYPYSHDDTWRNTTAVITGSKTDRQFTVRFSNVGGSPTIFIGDVGSSWSYLQVFVTDVQVGYSSATGFNDYNNGWSIGFETTSYGTVNSTITATLPASDWNKLANMPATVWHSANDGAGSGLRADVLESGMISDLNTAWQDQGTSEDNGLQMFRYQGSAANKPAGTDNANWVMNIYSHAGSGANYPYGHQLAAGNTEDIYFRRVSNGSFSSWRKVWHDGNFTNNSANWNTAYGWGNHSGLYIGRSTNTWHTDTNGHQRLYFASSSHTYVKAYDQVILRVDNSGHDRYIFDGTTATFDAQLLVTGDITAFYSSDARLKDNVRTIDNALGKLSRIGGYHFEWNKLSEHEGTDVGVIAQEIKEILPEVVTERDNGYLAVRYEKIVPLLIEGTKDLKKELDSERKRADLLEAQLAALMKRVEKLETV